MNRPGHTVYYYFSWIALGIAAGVAILLFTGMLQLTVFGTTIGSTDHPTSSASRNGYSHAVARTAPAVVSISTLRVVETAPRTQSDMLLERYFGLKSPQQPQKQTRTSSASGVILDQRGYILTNYHVIEKADVIQVTLNDGRSAEARHVGQDPDTDLAVLKIDLDNIPVAPAANIEQVRIGDVVLAIGYPFEIGQTVTQGIISATGRTRVSANTYENFLQTDAAINPGNSGGALINVNGEIVGINSLIYTSTGNFNGIGFAIPIDLALNVLEQIATQGYVVRGWLGVEGKDLNPSTLNKIGLQDTSGILVTDIDIGGPGHKAGLLPGDIITRINKQPIRDTADIMNLIAAGKPGDVFTIDGIRQRSSFSLEAELGQRPLMSK